MSYVFGIWGPTKVGRTTFISSAPGLAVAEFDIGGLARGSTLEQREQMVDIHSFMVPIQMVTVGQHPNWNMRGATELWLEFNDWYWSPLGGKKTGIIYNPDVQSIGIDTATELYSVRTDHELQQIQINSPGRKMLDPTEYKNSYSDLSGLTKLARKAGKNLIMAFQERPIYVNDVQTQEMEHKGWSPMPYDMDVVMRFSLAENSKPQAKVEQCGVGSSELRGMIIPEPTWDKAIAMIEAASTLRRLGMPIPPTLAELVELAAAL